MNQPYNDNASRMLHRYLDAELHPALEPGLFQAIAESSELQKELRQYLAIRSFLYRDGAQIAPAVHLKDRILSSVTSGSKFPPESVGESAARSAGRRRWWGGGGAAGSAIQWIVLPVVTALIASLATSVYYTQKESTPRGGAGAYSPLAGNASGDGTTSAHRRDRAPVSGGREDLASSQPVPAADARSRDGSSLDGNRGPGGAGNRAGADGGAETMRSTKSAHHSVSQLGGRRDVRRSSSSIGDDRSHSIWMVLPRSATASSIVAPDDSSMTYGATREHHALPASSSLSQLQEDSEEDPMAIVVQARGYLGRSFPSIPPPEEKTSPFVDKSLGAYLQLDEHHRIGLAGGMESFAQVFRREENGHIVRYEQSPSIIWGGVAYRYTTGEVVGLPGVRTFAEGLIGGTEMGGVGRFIVGFDYMPEERISIHAGADGALLFYGEQGTTYTTRKLGLTYGVSVTLGSLR